MHQERHFPGASSGPISSIPDFAALRARLRRARRDGRAHGASSPTRSSARSPPAGRRVLELRIDPEAITPRTTLSAIRARRMSERRRAPRRRAGGADQPLHRRGRAGDLLFVSGCVPVDGDGNLVAGDIVAQTRQVFANIARVLAAAGAGFGDVVKVTVFLHRHRRPRGGEHRPAGGLRRRAPGEHARRGEPARDPGRAHRGRSRRLRAVSDPYNAVITEVEPAPALPGPLHGRRLLVKDLIDTAGIRTTYGSRIYADHVPREPRRRSSGSSRPARSSSARRTCTSSPGA